MENLLHYFQQKKQQTDLKLRSTTAYRKRKYLRTVVYVFLVLFGLSWAVFGVIRLFDWTNTHEVIFQTPVIINFQDPVVVKTRITKVIVLQAFEYPEEAKTDIEKYICDKWGEPDCKIALAVSKAENGTREPERYNINYGVPKGYEIDMGIYQINSIHWGEDYCGGLIDVVDPFKNVDCAYNIWDMCENGIYVGSAGLGNKKGGFDCDWVAFNNGNYKAKL